MCDAAKPDEKYIDNEGRDITHIYSYNKVMSPKDLCGMANILNRTNFRLLAWYFGPTTTRKAGLRNFKCLGKMSMPSTGKQKFSVFVYFKTARYEKGIEAAWK